MIYIKVLIYFSYLWNQLILNYAAERIISDLLKFSLFIALAFGLGGCNGVNLGDIPKGYRYRVEECYNGISPNGRDALVAALVVAQGEDTPGGEEITPIEAKNAMLAVGCERNY